MFQLVIVCAVAASAVALSPLPPLQPLQPLKSPYVVPPVNPGYYPNPYLIPILRQVQDIQPDGSYQYDYQTANGISAQEVGTIRLYGPEQASKTVQGSAAWTSPEGVPVSFTYVADENGYRAEGSHVPKVPVAIQRSLDYLKALPQQKTY